jgi:hypothetical protein
MTIVTLYLIILGNFKISDKDSKGDSVMAETKVMQLEEKIIPKNNDDKEVNNIKRIFTMLDKALERILRRCYYKRNQYPPIAFKIEEQINILVGWIGVYQLYCALPGFRLQVGLAMEKLKSEIGQLMTECKPLAGKRGIKKTANSRVS